jgi:leucyl-tRNA synthetase
MKYEPKLIEPKWQAFWEEKRCFEAETGSLKPKYYALDMFPYPSSTGLHVGHPEGYTATDILARYKRACGFNVLHPMGWDAFGLPAEQHALKTGVHPEKTTQQAIANFKRQLKSLGFSYDWSREISTCDPTYYRWTQFLFLKLYERGLAYQKEVAVNWCPELKTVLANEEVLQGRSERGNHPVFRIPMKQWMLKITDYAEALLKDLDALDWPEGTKELQRNWIGKSEGLLLRFPVIDQDLLLEAFTTRCDTIFGVTFLVLAPEHPWVESLTAPSQREKVRTYQKQAAQKSEVFRKEANQEKTGVFLGSFAYNPWNQEKVPIWIADYVLTSYGTGIVMGVPGHDDRDADFASKYQLPIKQVLEERDGQEFLVNSQEWTGWEASRAKEEILTEAQKRKWGTPCVQYKLRDWLFSRQRYWGEPFPILHLQEKILPLAPQDLPVLLPEVESYEPSGTGESPLASIASWVNVVDPVSKQQARRETDTMPGSAASSWYFLRFCDPHNEHAPFDQEAVKYWMPVDIYVGGAEHAVGHLLYARFWMKVLFDMGWVSHSEPFGKLVHQGMILGEDGEKMSKSKGNVINPDEVVAAYGADTLRVYEMFLGPLEKEKPWSTSAIEGIYRFLQRSFRLFAKDGIGTQEPTSEQWKTTHRTIQKVTHAIEHWKFNTAISHLMVFVNTMTAESIRPQACLRSFVQLLQPFAPHLAEELWEILGEKGLLTFEAWPTFDPSLVTEEGRTLAIQVMGKLRGTLELPCGTDQTTVEELARQIPSVAEKLQHHKIQKIIFVPDKILNFVLQGKASP